MAAIAETLASFAADLRFEDLPHTVVHEAKRRVVDSLGCALGALAEQPVVIASSLAMETSTPRGATLLGARAKTTPDMASFANGVMIRYLDYNDTYLSLEPAHPSDNLSAALAAAESEGRGGRDLITAIVLGYEVQCRLCDAASLRARGWDHVTYGSLSTALAAGKLLGLTKRGMVHALGLAGVANVALRQTRLGELSMWKGCAFANAARNGVFAAMLAKRGMTGPAPIFEGENGFFKLVSGPFEIPTLGESFKILETYIKHYPAEYHAQTAIEAALKARGEIGSVEEIVSVTIESFDACVDIIASEPEKWHPASRETADHSLPYCVAAALMDGQIGRESFAPERIADPRLRSLMQKIRVVRNPELTAQYPEAMPNDLRVELASGRMVRVRVNHARGHPKNPMTDGQVESKFRELASEALSSEQSDRILAATWELERVSDLGSWMGLFVVEQPGGRE